MLNLIESSHATHIFMGQEGKEISPVEADQIIDRESINRYIVFPENTQGLVAHFGEKTADLKFPEFGYVQCLDVFDQNHRIFIETELADISGAWLIDSCTYWLDTGNVNASSMHDPNVNPIHKRTWYDQPCFTKQRPDGFTSLAVVVEKPILHDNSLRMSDEDEDPQWLIELEREAAFDAMFEEYFEPNILSYSSPEHTIIPIMQKIAESDHLQLKPQFPSNSKFAVCQEELLDRKIVNMCTKKYETDIVCAVMIARNGYDKAAGDNRIATILAEKSQRTTQSRVKKTFMDSIARLSSRRELFEFLKSASRRQ